MQGVRIQAGQQSRVSFATDLLSPAWLHPEAKLSTQPGDMARGSGGAQRAAALLVVQQGRGAAFPSHQECPTMWQWHGTL